MRYILAALIMLFSSMFWGQHVVQMGMVRSEDGEPSQFASVGFISQSGPETYGATCDEYGRFQVKVKPGKYRVHVHLVGYFDYESLFEVHVDHVQTIDITLVKNERELQAIQIYADKKDLAREVAQHAIDNRTLHLGKNNPVHYNSYMRTSVIQTRPDTAEFGKDSAYIELKYRDRPLITEQLHLIESVSDIVFSPPNDLHQVVNAYNNFKPDKPYNPYAMSITFEYGEPDVIPQKYQSDDNYVLKSYAGFNEFSLYNRLLDIPSITEKKVLSPIGEGAMLSYRYDLSGIYFVDSVRVFVIAVNPIFPGEPLFKGEIQIREDNWAVIAADLQLSKQVLFFHERFKIRQEYMQIKNMQYFLSENIIEYSIKDGHNKLDAQLLVMNNAFMDSTAGFAFDNEVIRYDENAFDKDPSFWIRERPISLNPSETSYANRCDSLQAYYSTDAYIDSSDSSYNQLRFMDFILYGVGFRNSKKKQQVYINPLIMQINPVGIGGYRHRFGASYQKEFDNAFLLETDGMIDYGFRNHDVRGKLGAGLTYVPKKFVRTFIRAGDFYDMINTYASLGSVFSRSNYVRTQTFSIAQRMEVVNGLFAELTYEYSDQKPINNLAQDKWSQRAFGEVNSPIDFERYTKSELRLDVKYRFAQKYVIRKNKKILLGSIYPVLGLVYRKGIPGMFSSEVNFDYIELSAQHEKELGRMGNMEWSVLAGSFVNKKNLRILEHRYFRGSDMFFFSDPLRSFQLLGPTLSTSNAYLRGNYFHHLNGIILNKIPLLRRLKLNEAVGAGFLSIPSQNFFHAEFYAGVERVVRIRQDIFRFGIYACTADSTLNKARFEFKIGVNFFDSFHKKWNY